MNYYNSQQIILETMGPEELYDAYFSLFDRHFVGFKKRLTDKEFTDELYDLRNKVKAIDMEGLLEKVFEAEPSNTRTKLLEYFAKPEEEIPLPIMLYYPKLCIRYYEETSDYDVLINLEECSNTISSTIGMKCDAEAVYMMQMDYHELFEGLRDSPKSLKKRSKFIDQLMDYNIDREHLKSCEVLIYTAIIMMLFSMAINRLHITICKQI